MTLTDQGGYVVGGDALEDQSEAGLLRVEEGDELTDWSEVPVKARAHYGYQLRRSQKNKKSEAPVAEEEPVDLAALFTITEL